MKAIKQRFHQQIVKKYKQNYFATVRKEILQIQEFQALYNKILDNNQDLSILIQKLGFIVFQKHINQILDEKLYTKLYQNEKYFLLNLNFVGKLLSYNVLPVAQINMLIVGLSQIIRKYKDSITALNIKEIFQILQLVLQRRKYLNQSLGCIKNERLILGLYQMVVRKQMEEYFFKIICFCKVISDQKVTHITNQQLINCLQMHILTCNKAQQLYVSYSYLADIFDRVYTKQQQLFQYGSILDKTMKDIFRNDLIDPISYFFIKVLNNDSLLKLVVEMKFAQTILRVIENVLLRRNNVSVFGHQSMWNILRKITEYLRRTDNLSQLTLLGWDSVIQRLESPHLIKFPYVKLQILQCLKQLCQTSLKNIFIDLLPLYEFQVNKLQS